MGAFGRQCDGSTVRQTPIFIRLAQGTFPLPEEKNLPRASTKAPFYLIGDEAYPLRTFLMRPFPRTVLTDERREFNRRISRARQCIECAFGILTAKWRCLKTELELSPAKVDNVVKACCILHNLIIDEEGLLVRPSRGELAEESPRSVGRHFNHSPKAAVKVRDLLVDYFTSPAGSLQRN